MPTASIAARYFGACSYQRSSSTRRTGAGALLVRTTVALRDGERTERRVRVRTSRASQVAVAGTVTLTVSVADVQDGTIRYGALRRVGQSAPSTVGTTTSGIPPRPVLRDPQFVGDDGAGRADGGTALRSASCLTTNQFQAHVGGGGGEPVQRAAHHLPAGLPVGNGLKAEGEVEGPVVQTGADGQGAEPVPCVGQGGGRRVGVGRGQRRRGSPGCSPRRARQWSSSDPRRGRRGALPASRGCCYPPPVALSGTSYSRASRRPESPRPVRSGAAVPRRRGRW
jgi:hypothetical protein